jgi:hypothetical protein
MKNQSNTQSKLWSLSRTKTVIIVVCGCMIAISFAATI